MLDQLTIGNKKSLEDFDASLKERRVSAPEKKSIKETVPYSNLTYDFSAINGEVYWEERELEYVFEIMAESPVAMERKKAAFSDWVMNVMEQPIYDPYEPGWHYVGTFDSIDYEDDESMEKTTITVVFFAYPYKISSTTKEASEVIPAASTVAVTIANNSSHRITPTFIVKAPLIICFENTTYSLPAGEITDDSFKFKVGENVLTVINNKGEDCVLTVKFIEEVL